MARKRFDHAQDVLVDQTAVKDVDDYERGEELYRRVGARFPVAKWVELPNGRVTAVIDTADLPSGVTAGDVETALANMKQDGWI